ncbi:hypothetical protein H4R34_003467 [Dimargaris verticillata]|uniref:ABC transporter domain-containing protein n=1 Tax=Dimargaris verticillata TaxID=2761393 RepID=A0A9W8AZZ0_9FUNG|nr:hypothetical protein H4R34_003467 [Dimargaris verticillata]
MATLRRQYPAMLRTQVLNLFHSPATLFVGVIFPVFTVFIGILIGKLVNVPNVQTGDVGTAPLGGMALPRNALIPYVVQDDGLTDAWQDTQQVLAQYINTPQPRHPNFTAFASLQAIDEYQRDEIVKENRDRSYEPRQPVGGYYLRSQDPPTTRATTGRAAYDYTVLYDSDRGPILPSLVHLMEAAMAPVDAGVPEITGRIETFPAQPSENTDITAKIIPIIMTYGLAFTIVTVAFTIVHERESGITNYLWASGLRVSVYYLAVFTRDLALYLFPTTLGCILLVAFRIPFFIHTSFLAFFFILYFSGPELIFWGYLFALPFKRSENVPPIVSFLISILVFLPYLIIELAYDATIGNLASYLLTAFVPIFGLIRGVRELAEAATHGKPYSTADTFDTQYPILGMFLIIVAKSVVLGCLLVFIQRQRLQGITLRTMFQRAFTGHGSAPSAAVDPDDPHRLAQSQLDQIMDSEVLREKSRLQANGTPQALDSDAVQICGLEHTFSHGTTGPARPILRDLWFSIHRHECFGYLGPNGAGKTTSLNILTGLLQPSAGQAYIRGHSVVPHSPAIKTLIGVCPQFDILWPTLTGREHLRLMAAIRGVPLVETEASIDQVVNAMALGPVVDKFTKGYSGGNKRRLSLAMACIGAPPVLFLDEPTTGVDVKVRQSIWEAVRMLKLTSAVVLTTHSMEEAEALCDRIGIIVNGNLKCLGTPQRLKNVYGRGWKVLVKATSLPSAARTIQAMVDTFVTCSMPEAAVECKLVQQLGVNLEFEISRGEPAMADPQVTHSAPGILGPLFTLLETSKQHGETLDYSVNQTTLSQVFIDFAKLQINY